MLIAELVCYMELHNRTVDLESMCGGGNSRPAVQVQVVQSNARSEADRDFLNAYERLSRYEDPPIRSRMLETVRTQSQRLLYDGRRVCLASSDTIRERVYLAKLEMYRRVPGNDGKFLVANNRLVYVLAKQYLCS